MAEQRKHPRVKASLEAKVSFPGQDVLEGRVQNISMTGLNVILAEAPPDLVEIVYESVEIELSVPGDPLSMSLWGTVVWTSEMETDKRSHNIGIELKSVGAKEKKRLVELLKRLKA